MNCLYWGTPWFNQFILKTDIFLQMWQRNRLRIWDLLNERSMLYRSDHWGPPVQSLVCILIAFNTFYCYNLDRCLCSANISFRQLSYFFFMNTLSRFRYPLHGGKFNKLFNCFAWEIVLSRENLPIWMRALVFHVVALLRKVLIWCIIYLVIIMWITGYNWIFANNH